MKRLSLLLLMAASLSAGTVVNVTIEGTGGTTNAAGIPVLPYFLSIDGGPTISADCYDFFDFITPGETWMANVDTLSEAVASGRFSSDPNALARYKLVAVLSVLAALSPQDDIDLQQDLWNVFDPGAFPVASPGMTAFLATANADLPTFDFSRVEFLEPAAGVQAQAFAIPLEAPGTPEPSTLLMIAAGFIVIGRRKWRSRQQ
jgi:hypothetical protein